VLSLDVDTYFQVVIYLLMALTFVALTLIFLHMLYGKEEEKKT
jgi:hypothetical protein